ncbi:MAG: HU family DNA-binding protein [bacterium]
MNKAEFVKAVADEAGIAQSHAASAVDAVVKVVSKALAKRDAVRLVGFGSFETRKRAARNGVVPGTKKPIKIPARTVPFFKPGSKLRKQVWKG